MKQDAIFNALEAIKKDLAEIKESISRLPRRRPLPPGANSTGRKGKCYSRKLRGGFRDPEIRATILKLRREGQNFKSIAIYIREHWAPALWVSKSAIHRFVADARNGRLCEFGIEGIDNV